MILVLNGYELQLKSSAISQTFQVNDLADLKDRQAGHSNTIKVPRTPHNERIMGLIGVRSNSNLHTKRLHAKVISNGIEIVRNGYAVISGVSDYYNVSVYDSVIALQEELGDKTLQDLNYSDVNHYINMAAFQSGMQHRTGYVNAICDFGNGIMIEYLPASVFVSTLWDKIFKEADFTYSGAIFQSEKFNHLVIPPSRGYDVNTGDTVTNTIGSIDSNLLSIGITQNSSNFYKTNEDYVFPTQSIGNGLNSGGNIIISNEGIYVFDISISGLNQYEEEDEVFVIARLKVNDENKIYFDSRNSSKKSVLFLRSGDVVSFNLSISYFPVQNPETVEDFHNVVVTSSVSISISKQLGGVFLNYTELMPKILKKDFVKDIMQRFGLLMRPNKFDSRHYEFIQIEELLNNRASAEDWSDKYVSHTETYEVGSYGRENFFKYDYDKDDLDREFADGVMRIENQTIVDTKEVVTSPYTAIKSSRNLSNINLYNVHLWEKKDNVTEAKESSAHIFAISRHNVQINVHQLGVDNYTTLQGDFPYLDFVPCYYQNYVNDSYKAFSYLLNKGKKIKSIMRLNAVDIYNINFFRLKYIEQLGAYFYLNKISNFKGRNTVQVELIEVGDIVFNSPPQIMGGLLIHMQQKSVHTVTWEQIIQYYYDKEGDNPVAIKFIELPGYVSIKLNNSTISTNTEISKEAIMLGRLKIEAPASENDFSDLAKFQIKDSGSGNFSADIGTMAISVSGRENTVPLVNAGADQNAIIQDETLTIELNGTANDDVEISETKWTQVSGAEVTITNDTALNASISISTKGTYVFRLTANDNDGATSHDEVIVRCFEQYTNISATNTYADKYSVKIVGESNATIQITASTSEYLGAWVNGTQIGKNDTKGFSITLNSSGEYMFEADLFVEKDKTGRLTLIIDSISDGMLGASSLILSAAGINSGFEKPTQYE